MIIFYPRDIGLWRSTFDFQPHHLGERAHKVFQNRDEFVRFLAGHKVRLDDKKFPLTIDSVSECAYKFGSTEQGDPFVVIQWTVIGWIRETTARWHLSKFDLVSGTGNKFSLKEI